MTLTRTKDTALPTKLKKAWKGSDVLVLSNKDTYIVKRVHKAAPGFRKKLRAAGKKITKKELADAITSARR